MAEPTYRIHIAAQMVGISEGLLRAWERRYGVVRPKRTTGGYRAYTEQDIEVLKRLRALTEQGVSIAEAAKLLPDIRRELRAEEPPVAPRLDRTRLEHWREELLGASERADQLAAEQIVDEALASLPPVLVYEQVLVPVQREVGVRWHEGRLSVGCEHLLSQVIRGRLAGLVRQVPSSDRRHVVCACFPDEQHDIGLLGAALRFRTAGWRVTYLGPRTPTEDLALLVGRLAPRYVALSAVNDPGRRAFTAQLRASVEALPPRTAVLVGGGAAERYADECRALAASLVPDDDAWQSVLASARPGST